MPFLCPECGSMSLSIVQSIELPYDARSDEITLQVVECSGCRFSGIAVYEESRRGGLDSESVDHQGYRVSAEVLGTLKRTISRCPRPREPRCGCRTHATLGRRNELSRWDWLERTNVGKRFRMVL